MDGCHLGIADVVVPECVYGAPSSGTTVMLVGDSHAAQWLPALERLSRDRGWRLIGTTKSGCPVVNVSVWLRPQTRAYRECQAWRERVLERAAQEHPAIVFVASTNDYQVLHGSGRRPVAEVVAVWRSGLAAALAQMHEVADEVVLLADTPRHRADPVECLVRHRDLDACRATRNRLVDEAYAQLEIEAAVQASAKVITPADWLCPDDTCPLVMGNTLVYRDTDHLTARFASMLADRLGYELDRAQVGTVTDGHGPSDSAEEGDGDRDPDAQEQNRRLL
jgi:hypothetical protein